MSDESKIVFDARNAEKDVIREVDLRARVKMSSDSKLDYGKAVRLVFMADVELHRAYLSAIPR